MKYSTRHNDWMHATRRTLGGFAGFTLVELMVGMVMGGLVATAIMSAYLTTANHIREQRDVTEMHMNQRGAIEDMELQIRMAGYDPLAPMARNLFGITNVKRWTIQDEMTAPVESDAGSPSLTLSYDEYATVAADGSQNANDSFISYRLMDEDNDRIYELVRDVEPGDSSGLILPRAILAENIHAIGFAYAVDDNGDGELDTIPANDPNGSVIWAVDSDNDNVLDTNLDVNNDGIIDLTDDTSGDDMIDMTDPGPGRIATTYPLSSIRAVRIWLLARAEKLSDDYADKDKSDLSQGSKYLVGDRIYTAKETVADPAKEFHHSLKVRLMARTIECRNLGVTP
jgi:type IV pilus assembly protein PilW